MGPFAGMISCAERLPTSEDPAADSLVRLDVLDMLIKGEVGLGKASGPSDAPLEVTTRLSGPLADLPYLSAALKISSPFKDVFRSVKGGLVDSFGSGGLKNPFESRLDVGNGPFLLIPALKGIKTNSSTFYYQRLTF